MDKELATRVWNKKFKSLLEKSNLPTTYWEPQTLVARELDLDAWDYLEEVRANVVEEVANGLSLIISSINVGNGKTSWAIRLLQRYLAETALDGRLVDKGLFISYATLLTNLSDFKYRETEEFKEMQKRLLSCELLVIDELGGGTINKFNYPLLYEIIDTRCQRKLATIYTTNYTEEYIKDQLGERLFSRIYDFSILVQFVSSNVRGKTLQEIEEEVE